MNMIIIHNPITPLAISKKLAAAIGTFDGVHRGHQSVIEKVINESQKNQTPSALITYDNHPSEILRSDNPTPLIYSNTHRLKLLEATSIDYLILFTFDNTFASQNAEDFLNKLHILCPFSYLNMGYDGRIGKNRTGDKEHLTHLAEKQGFKLEYMPPLQFNDEPISSTVIRKHIQEGNIEKASSLLGRPYSILGYVLSGKGLGSKIGFPTANIQIAGIVTPPSGVWAVEAIWDGHHHKAVANLGTAPTLHHQRELLLEVHIPHLDENLYGKSLEVVFKKHLRSEKKFDSVEALKQQLHQDVLQSMHS